MMRREPTGHEPRAMQRGLLMLEAVAEIGPGATAKQIAERTGIPRATAYKLLNILVADGYLVRIADLTGFALGIRTRQLAGRPDAVAEDRNAELLAGMRRSVRFGVFLAGFGNDNVYLVDHDPDHELAGASVMCDHPHASAVGKIMLAAGSQLPSTLHSLTPHTITDPVTLADHLARVRADGLAVEVDESRAGRSALAVPVTDTRNRVTGALTVIGRTGRLPLQEPALILLLRDTAAGLTLNGRH